MMKIKKCPFCGNENLEIEGDPYLNIYIQCDNCHTQMDIDVDMIKEEVVNLMYKILITRWNKRTK